MIHGTPEDVIGALASSVTVPDWRLASVLDGATDSILVCSDDGRVIYFNKSCERLFGCAADHIVGCHVDALLPQHDGPPLRGGDWTSRFHPAADAGPVRLRGFDGHEFAAEVMVSPAATGSYCLLIIREKMAQTGHSADGAGSNAAADAQAGIVRAARMAAMEELGGALAHKLNQPLTAVILYLQAIGRAYGRETEGNKLPEKVIAILEKAVREAERASSFLQRIRQAHDQDHDQDLMGSRPVDLNHVLEDVLDLGVFVDRPGARIDRLLTPRLPPVRGNPVELQQALIALMHAALEAAARAGAPGIRLATQRLGEHVMVVAELRPAAIRGATTHDGAVPGAVLGNPLGEIAINCAESTDGRRNCEKDLSIARAIAHDHGGELMVDCDGRDRGTRFTLRLPLLAEAASSL
ncbi:histidine kinase dimerization/phospho-acceptor domain-containing protein [Xanthobacteraceae bacterium Astr-EGSB]|uniref:PAS domain-containing protein n=1 Tax=Astrobacterium formosum TaxID=3069710 RepID=UPI0027B3C150|nr:histidine kinase dimerization/phospho-acceptor domain-containing protein [Xanthobacteraceae bacterium Astr-EGSB]